MLENGESLKSEQVTPPDQQALFDEKFGQVRREGRDRGYEQGMREAMAKMPPSVSPEEIQRLVDAKFEEKLVAVRQANEQKLQDQQAAQIHQQFEQGVSAGKGAYPDYDEKVKSLGSFADDPYIKYLAMQTGGDAAHIMMELASNPGKAVTLSAWLQNDLARGKGADAAINEVKRIAAGVKANADAKANINIRDPLHQIESSKAGANTAEPSFHDMLMDPKYRG